MAVVSVFDLVVEKTFDGADVGKGDADLGDAVVAGSAAAAGFGTDACSGSAGVDAGTDVTDVGVGLDPPILRLIVGAGGGASVCCGRSIGGGGGVAGCCGGS